MISYWRSVAKDLKYKNPNFHVRTYKQLPNGDTF